MRPKKLPAPSFDLQTPVGTTEPSELQQLQERVAELERRDNMAQAIGSMVVGLGASLLGVVFGAPQPQSPSTKPARPKRRPRKALAKKGPT